MHCNGILAQGEVLGESVASLINVKFQFNSLVVFGYIAFNVNFQSPLQNPNVLRSNSSCEADVTKDLGGDRGLSK